jgi:hypothetical protein
MSGPPPAGVPLQGKQYLTLFVGLAELSLIGGVWYFVSKASGTNDTSNDIAKAMIPATGMTIAIVFCHTLLWYVYYTYHPLSMNLYFLMMTSISMIISLIALCIAMVNKTTI